MKTTEGEWELIEEVSGNLQAELIRELLEAQEIEAILFQESAGRVYGLTVGPLGMVQIFVRKQDLQRARIVLEEYHKGSAD